MFELLLPVRFVLLSVECLTVRLCSRLRLCIMCLVVRSQRDVVHELPTLGVMVVERSEVSPVRCTVL